MQQQTSRKKKESIQTILSSLYWTERQVKLDVARLEELRTAAAGGGAVDYGRPIIHGGTPQTMGDKVVYLIEFEKRLQSDVDERHAAAERVLAIINAVEDARLRYFLTLRYREFKSMKEIGRAMGYSGRHSLRVHKLALRAADKVWKKMEVAKNDAE